MKNLLILMAVLRSATGAAEVIYAQVGEKVTLKPPAGIDLQKHYLYWNFGDSDIAWRNTLGGSMINEKWKRMVSLSDGSLIISNIQNFSTYSCQAKLNSIPVTSATYELRKLNMSMSPRSPLLPGETLSLVCRADSTPDHNIHWLNPRGQKMGNSRGRVTVTATGQVAGQWTCVVTDAEKEHKAKISVTVMDLSPTPLSAQYTSKSSPLTIPCSIPRHVSWEQIKAKGIQGGNWNFSPKPGSRLTPGDPQRLFSLSLEDPPAWKADQDRGLTPAADLRKGELSLRRKKGREEDRGDYVCSLKFQNGLSLSTTVHVNVLQILSSQGTDFISGQQVNLTCGLGYPLPSDLRLLWFPPEQSSMSSPTSDHRSACLTIPEVAAGDGGEWRCELWRNNTRLTSAVIALKIEPRLSVWMLVIICGVTVIVVLVLILVLIHYRRRQRKTRHLRHRLCMCENPKPKGFYRT